MLHFYLKLRPMLAAMCTYWSHCFYYLGCFVFVHWWLINIHTTPISQEVETLCKMAVTTECKSFANPFEQKRNWTQNKDETKYSLTLNLMPATCFKRTGTGACFPLCYITLFFRKQHSVSVCYEMTLIIGVSKWNSAPFSVNIGRQLLNSQFRLYFVLHNTWHIFSGGGGGAGLDCRCKPVVRHAECGLALSSCGVSRDISENDVVGAGTDVPLAQTHLHTSTDANFGTLCQPGRHFFAFFGF